MKKANRSVVQIEQDIRLCEDKFPDLSAEISKEDLQSYQINTD